MKNTIKNSVDRIKENYLEYLVTNGSIQLIKSMILIPIYSMILGIALKQTKVFAFTDSNITELLKNPLALVVGLIGIIIMAISIFYELGYYFLLADHQINNKEYNARGLLKTLKNKSSQLLSFNSVILILYLIVLIPVVSVGLESNIGLNLKVPEFITDELLNTDHGPYIYFAIVAILTLITMKLIYTVYFMVTEDGVNSMHSVKKSWKFSKGKVLKNIILLFVTTFLFGLFVGLILVVTFLPLIISENIYPGISWLTSAISLTLAQVVLIFLGGLLQALIVNVLVETVYSKDKAVGSTVKEKTNAERRYEKLLLKLKNNKVWKFIIILVPVVLLGANIFLIKSTIYKPMTAVVAHRGYMEKGVENSITALEGAARAGAEMVELDIQETKDGELVVMHDFNLKRLAKVNKNIYDMTLEEIQELEISQNGFKDKIPTLSEFIDVAKREKIDLLVEIKPHGHESEEMEANLIKLLEEKKVKDEYIVQSLDINTIDKIKELDSEVKTCYIIPFLLGKLPETKHDYLGIEDFSASERLIEESRENYEGILIWTINREDLMKKYFNLNVNGIITNNLEMALRVREELEENSFVTRVQTLLGN